MSSQGICQAQAALTPIKASPMMKARKPIISGTNIAELPRQAPSRPVRPRFAPQAAITVPNAIRGNTRYSRHERLIKLFMVIFLSPLYRLTHEDLLGQPCHLDDGSFKLYAEH
jgi:hypothetical protein